MREIEKRRLLSKMESFGLGSTDADIYLASLEIGPATIQELSKVTKLNRVTVHSAVERATRKGFFSESRKKNRRLIVPADPNVLRQIVERKERELQSMSDGIEQMIESLSGIQTTSRYFPTVRFYEGSEGFFTMMNETYEAKNDVYVFSYIPLFEQAIGEEQLAKYLLTRGKKGIFTRLLFSSGPTANKIHEQRHHYNVEVRVVPEGLTWAANIFMWNDSIGLGSLKEGRLTCTIIENKDLAAMFRLMHELMWKQANRLYS